MKIETFEKVKPQKDEWCGIVYLWNGNKCEEKDVKFYGVENENAMFQLCNWANDWVIIPIKNLLFIRKRS